MISLILSLEQIRAAIVKRVFLAVSLSRVPLKTNMIWSVGRERRATNDFSTCHKMNAKQRDVNLLFSRYSSSLCKGCESRRKLRVPDCRRSTFKLLCMSSFSLKRQGQLADDMSSTVVCSILRIFVSQFSFRRSDKTVRRQSQLADGRKS